MLAFNTDKNAPCPRGWKLFDEASGRFIVGAGFGDGLTPRNVKDKGGEEMHKLEFAEMPSHGHRISTNNESNIHDGLGGSSEPHGILSTFADIPDKPGWPAVLPKMLENTGGDQPHNTMPPFVALYYCIKE